MLNTGKKVANWKTPKTRHWVDKKLALLLTKETQFQIRSTNINSSKSHGIETIISWPLLKSFSPLTILPVKMTKSLENLLILWAINIISKVAEC